MNSMSTAAPTPAESVETLKADITKLSETVKQLAVGEFDAVTGNIRGKTKAKFADFEDAVHANPSQALLMAVGVGVVLGMIIRR